MRTLRVRLTLWFTLSFLLVIAVFMTLTYRDLDLQLRRKTFEREFDINPNWILHGSYSEEEVRGIMSQLLVSSLTFSLPLVLATLGIAYFLARKSLRPVARLNEQLLAISPGTLQQRVSLPEADEQLRDLVSHLNAMLARLEASFREMGDYAGRVAHELRTPLMILRLKVEQSGDRIDPALAEELQVELHRLAHVVEQSLLIAKADQGRLRWEPAPLDLATVLMDLARDFHLLAQEEKRSLRCSLQTGLEVVSDAKHCKQILHSLLTNSLIHGQGDILIRVKRHQGGARVLILNSIQPRDPRGDQTLGLGLRVVKALLGLQPEVIFRQHHGTQFHASFLQFPALKTPDSAVWVRSSPDAAGELNWTDPQWSHG